MNRAEVAQHLGLLGATHDVHEADAVGGADPHEHLPKVGGGGGVDEGAVALGAHRLDHRQRGERVDEQRRALGGAHVVGQLHDRGRVGDAVVSPHRPAEQRDATADQRGRFRAGRDNGACALVADRQRLIQPVAIQRQRRLWNRAHEIRPVGAAARQATTAPSSTPRSEGLIGDASTATTTSLPPGSGTSRSANSSRKLAAGGDRGSQTAAASRSRIGRHREKPFESEIAAYRGVDVAGHDAIAPAT